MNNLKIGYGQLKKENTRLKSEVSYLKSELEKQKKISEIYLDQLLILKDRKLKECKIADDPFQRLFGIKGEETEYKCIICDHKMPQDIREKILSNKIDAECPGTYNHRRCKAPISEYIKVE